MCPAYTWMHMIQFVISDIAMYVNARRFMNIMSCIVLVHWLILDITWKVSIILNIAMYVKDSRYVIIIYV